MYKRTPNKYQSGGYSDAYLNSLWKNVVPQNLLTTATEATKNYNDPYLKMSLGEGDYTDEERTNILKQHTQVAPMIGPMNALMQGQQGYHNYLSRPKQDLTPEQGFHGFERGGYVPKYNFGDWIKRNVTSAWDDTKKVARGVGNVAHDFGRGVADQVGNLTGLYDLDNDKYKTGFGRSTAGIWNKAASTVGNVVSGGLTGGGSGGGNNQQQVETPVIEPPSRGMGFGEQFQQLAQFLPFFSSAMGMQRGGFVNNTGYTPGHQSFNNPFNVIPSNNITMQNTPFPVMGYGSSGQSQMMMPGNNYKFPGSRSVLEVPIKQFGGEIGEIEPQEHAVQTEAGEYIGFEDSTIAPVKAKKRHKNMDKDEVTDLLPEGAFVFSRDPSMTLYKNKKFKGIDLNDIVLGSTIPDYSENEVSGPPKEIKFLDFMRANKFTPADMARDLSKKYPVTSREHDAFATYAIEENKKSRSPYLEIIKGLNQLKKNKPDLYRLGGFVSNYQFGDYVDDPMNVPMRGEYQAYAPQATPQSLSYIAPQQRTALQPIQEDYRLTEREVLSEKGDPYEYFLQGDGTWYTKKKGAPENSWKKLNDKAIPIVEDRLRKGVYNAKPAKKNSPINYGPAVSYDYTTELPEVEVVGQRDRRGRGVESTGMNRTLGNTPGQMSINPIYQTSPLTDQEMRKRAFMEVNQYQAPQGYVTNQDQGAPYFDPRQQTYQEKLGQHYNENFNQAASDLGNTAMGALQMAPMGMLGNAYQNAAMFGRVAMPAAARAKQFKSMSPYIKRTYTNAKGMPKNESAFNYLVKNGYMQHGGYVNSPMYFRYGGSVPKFQLGGIGEIIGSVADIGFSLADRIRANKLLKQTMGDINNLEKRGEGYINNNFATSSAATLGNYMTQDPRYTNLDLSSPRAQAQSTYQRAMANYQNEKTNAANSAMAAPTSFARNAAQMGLNPQQAAAYLQSMNANAVKGTNDINARYNDAINKTMIDGASIDRAYDEGTQRDIQTGANVTRNNLNNINSGLWSGMGANSSNFFNSRMGLDSQSLGARMAARNQNANFLTGNNLRLSDSIGNLARSGENYYNSNRTAHVPITPQNMIGPSQQQLNYFNNQYPTNYQYQSPEWMRYQQGYDGALPRGNYGDIG